MHSNISLVVAKVEAGVWRGSFLFHSRVGHHQSVVIAHSLAETTTNTALLQPPITPHMLFKSRKIGYQDIKLLLI